jgi:hypothetical protein
MAGLVIEKIVREAIPIQIGGKPGRTVGQFVDDAIGDALSDNTEIATIRVEFGDGDRQKIIDNSPLMRKAT